MSKQEIRILNLEPEGYSPRAHTILLSIGLVDEGPMSRGALIDCLGQYHVLIVRLGHFIDGEVLGQSDRLKAIVTATTGLDHIDTACAEKEEIKVLSLQNEFVFLEQIWATAEHTFALLLSLIRKIPFAVESVLEGAWDRDCFRGGELNGKRLGILGYGRIGKKIATYGRAFGMKVGIFDPGKSGTLQNDNVTVFEDFRPFLEFSQFLTIHVPLNNETCGMLGEEQIMMLPRGAYLINTSRGGIINEIALLKALESGHLAGVALDVLEDEKRRDFLKKHPFLDYARRHNNLIITPHVGGAAKESMEKTEIFMAVKLKRFIEGL